MMKLELKHIAPYLPYGLKVLSSFNELSTISSLHLTDLESRKAVNLQLDGVPLRFRSDNLDAIKPTLRPLSDLQDFFKEYYGCLDHQDVTDYFDEDYLDSFELTIEDIEHITPTYLPYGTFTTLVKYHFDVFGLIEQGLAIDINTIEL